MTNSESARDIAFVELVKMLEGQEHMHFSRRQLATAIEDATNASDKETRLAAIELANRLRG